MSTLVCLTGRCTVSEVPTHRDLIAQALQIPDDMALDLRAVEQADVTLVQLLLAAQASATKQRRALHVSAWSAAAATAFDRAGVSMTTFAPLTSAQG